MTDRSFTLPERLPGQSFEEWVKGAFEELQRVSQEEGQLAPLSIDLDNLVDGTLIAFDATNEVWRETTITIPGSLPPPDGDKGDITVTSSGATWTIDPDTVTYDKMQDLSGAALLGGNAAGTISELTLGTNLSFSGATLNAEGGSKIIGNWDPTTKVSFPATNYATLDVRNGRPVLDFNTTTQEAAYFTGVMPDNYAGEGVTVQVWFTVTTVTSGTIGWDVSLELMTALDMDGDSFATAQVITAVTVSGTNGTLQTASVNIANGAAMDNLVAGSPFRLRIRRNVSADTAANDAELHQVEMRIQ